MGDTEQREKRHAALYFSPKNSSAFKELAARIRSDKGRTTLIWSQQWQGAESILQEARAVVVERGCKNADKIVEAYRRYAIDVEIHMADENGEFAEDIAQPDPEMVDQRTEMERAADEEAEAGREVIALETEIVENADGEVMFDPNVVVSDEQAEAQLDGATDDEEEHTDQDAETDPAMEEDGGAGEDPVDPDSDGEDAGTEDVGGEAGEKEPTDQS